MWKTNYSDTKVCQEAEGGGAPGIGAEIPLQPKEMIMVNQTLCRPWRTQQCSRMPWRKLQSVKSPCKSSLLSGTAALPENLLQHGTAAHGGSLERTHTWVVLEEPQPMRGTHVGAVSERLYLMGGTLHWRERELRRKENQRHGLTTTPIPHPPMPLCRDEENLEVKLTLEEEWKGGFVLFLTILLFY